MQIPEEYRCCICLSPPERALLTNCPHHVCESCVESGGIKTCPVCRADLPAERDTDDAFHRRLSCAVLRCECGSEMSVREGEHHVCEATRKRKRPPDVAPAAATARRPPAAPNRSTFACPLCDERNLTSQGLLEHCERAHACGRGPIAAPCPICLAMPWGDPSYVSRDFLAHLRLRHRCDYAVLADFDADEESMFRRALNDSLRTAGYGEELEEEERIMAQVLQESAREAEAAARAVAEVDAGGGESDAHATPLLSAADHRRLDADDADGENAWNDERPFLEDDEDVTSEAGSLENDASAGSLAKTTPDTGSRHDSMQPIGAIGGVGAGAEVAQTAA